MPSLTARQSCNYATSTVSPWKPRPGLFRGSSHGGMMKKPSATWHRRLAAPQRALQPAPPHLLRRRAMASAAAADGAAGAGPAVAPLTHQDNEYIQTPLKQGTYGFHLGQPGPDLIPLQRIKQAL